MPRPPHRASCPRARRRGRTAPGHRVHLRAAAPHLLDEVRAGAARPHRRRHRRGRHPRATRLGDGHPLPPRRARSVARFRAVNQAARARETAAEARRAASSRPTSCLAERSSDSTAVCDAVVAGALEVLRAHPLDQRPQARRRTPTLECTLSDGSGSLLLVFQGRSPIPGIERGARARRRGHGRLVAAQPRDHQPGLRARRGTRDRRADSRSCPWSRAPASLSTP